MLRYRDIGLDAPDAEPMQFWSSDSQDDLAAWLATREGQTYTSDEGFGDGAGDWFAGGGNGNVGEEPAS